MILYQVQARSAAAERRVNGRAFSGIEFVNYHPPTVYRNALDLTSSFRPILFNAESDGPRIEFEDLSDVSPPHSGYHQGFV